MGALQDLGFDDVGFRSHQIKTPTIDKLALEGVVLDQYYVQVIFDSFVASHCGVLRNGRRW